MSTEGFAFVIETSHSVTDAVIAIRKAAEAAKWGVLGGYNFDEILASKGFPQAEPLRSLELCSPGHADPMLAEDWRVALCLPCSIVITRQNGKTMIAALRPGHVMPGLFPDAGPAFAERARQVDAEIEAIVRQAAA